jgi:hypothetical protein
MRGKGKLAAGLASVGAAVAFLPPAAGAAVAPPPGPFGCLPALLSSRAFSSAVTGVLADPAAARAIILASLPDLQANFCESASGVIARLAANHNETVLSLG